MRVILLKEVKGLGKIFDVKNVSDGYARNFLIPKGLAKIADENSIKELESRKSTLKNQHEKETEKLKVVAKKLAGHGFKFQLKIGERGGIFGSVGKEEIKKAVFKEIPDNNFSVHLERPIKTLGEHNVEIELLNSANGLGLMEKPGNIKSKIKILIFGQK